MGPKGSPPRRRAACPGPVSTRAGIAILGPDPVRGGLARGLSLRGRGDDGLGPDLDPASASISSRSLPLPAMPTPMPTPLPTPPPPPPTTTTTTARPGRHVEEAAAPGQREQQQEQQEQEQQRQIAVGSLLTDDAFLPGVEALVASLRAHNGEILQREEDAVALCVLVTPQVSRTTKHILRRRLKVQVVEVEAVANRFEAHVEGWKTAGLSKLQIWTLTQFRRFVYIDADCVVVGSIARLLSADLGVHGLAAAPDLVPPDRFNAGVLVIRPDAAVYARMESALAKGALESYDGGDTGFLNAFYPDWHAWPPANRLGFRYNAQRLARHLTRAVPAYWSSIDPCIIHYSSTPKPWDAGANKTGELEEIWWRHYLPQQ